MHAWCGSLQHSVSACSPKLLTWAAPVQSGTTDGIGRDHPPGCCPLWHLLSPAHGHTGLAACLNFVPWRGPVLPRPRLCTEACWSPGMEVSPVHPHGTRLCLLAACQPWLACVLGVVSCGPPDMTLCASDLSAPSTLPAYPLGSVCLCPRKRFPLVQ